jgi:hypothetical protein
LSTIVSNTLDHTLHITYQQIALVIVQSTSKLVNVGVQLANFEHQTVGAIGDRDSAPRKRILGDRATRGKC